MKKYGVILMLAIMICVIGCGKEEKDNNQVTEVEGEQVTNEENYAEMETDSTDNENNIVLPDIEYEEWVRDGDGKKRFGFNVPLGWEYTGVGLKASDSESEDMYLMCVKGQCMDWYETEVAPEKMFEHNGAIVQLEKTFDTVYGTCKLFSADAQEENWADGVYALIKLDDEWCVMIQSSVTYEGIKSALLYMEEYVCIMTGPKQIPIVFDYEYPNWLTDDNGNKLMGFNAPIGMTRMENDPAVCFQDGAKLVRILNTDYGYAYSCMSGGNEGDLYTKKNEVDTIYGKAKIYDVKVAWGENNIYCEMAYFCVNGVYIWVQYKDYDAEGYTNQLEDIISNQLFTQE